MQLKDAEKHYCDAKEWQSAVQMYRTVSDAPQVAKVFGDVNGGLGMPCTSSLATPALGSETNLGGYDAFTIPWVSKRPWDSHDGCAQCI
jgi:hypothetical protein